MSDLPLGYPDCPECGGSGIHPIGPGEDSWDWDMPCHKCSQARESLSKALPPLPPRPPDGFLDMWSRNMMAVAGINPANQPRVEAQMREMVHALWAASRAAITPDLVMQEMHLDARGFSVAVRERGTHIMKSVAEVFLEMMKDLGAENYVETTFVNPAGEKVAVTIRFHDRGLTPHQMRAAAEARAAKAEEALALFEGAPACTTTMGYRRVRSFMRLAGQATPEAPAIPDLHTRRLRARLILEETLETIAALGFSVDVPFGSEDLDGGLSRSGTVVDVGADEVDLVERFGPDLVGIVDGCEDIRVVTTGTLIACGVEDQATSVCVDENNLAKFGPGGHRDEHGKWIKPPGHRPPDIAAVLRKQGADL